MTKIILRKIDEVYIDILTDEPSIHKEIEDRFTFRKPTFIPHNQRIWMRNSNPKVPLYREKDKFFYIGLLPELTEYFDKCKYPYEIKGTFSSENIIIPEIDEFIDSLHLPEKYVVRDYQKEYIIHCINEGRALCVAPTSSGKSLMQYILFRYWDSKTLLIVPTKNLVSQMYNDFKDYGYDAEKNIHCVTGGVDKFTDKKLICSTWQSIFNQDFDYYKDFKVIFGDEAHSFKADSLIGIMRKTVNSPIKIGFTGTTTKNELFDKQIEGLFGPTISFTTTKELIDKGISAPLYIKSVLLEHKDSPYRNYTEAIEYEDEISYLLNNESRKKFLVNLILQLKGNTLVMFKHINYGKELFLRVGDKSIYENFYIDGSSSVKQRDEIRTNIENSENSITFASVVFSTGVNIKKINNIVFIEPSKSRVRVLQSIGRGLRTAEGKNKLTLYDIADKIIFSGKNNTTLNHYYSRLKLYKTEGFIINRYFTKI